MPSELITISPIDGSELVRRAYTSDNDIAGILAQARTARRDWRARPLAERCAAVSAAVDGVMSGKADMARAITRQMGRPLRHTPGELSGFEERARYMIDAAAEALAPVEPPDKESRTAEQTHEPQSTNR